MRLPISDKPVVKYILEHCYARGVKHVVLSPGSRNAPFLLSFPASEKFDCLTIVDERSAAYFALGLARSKNQPVVLVCTSGTAALNYAPAIAEAYYQQIPLIVITADRPPELIDQADGQTIRQNGIYKNFIRYSFQTPAGDLNITEVSHLNRQLNETFFHALGDVKGPVHINVPLREPLYERDYETVETRTRVMPFPLRDYSDGKIADELLHELNGYDRIMLVVGAFPGFAMLQKLAELVVSKGGVVVAETLSNIQGPGIIDNIDRVLAGLDKKSTPLFKPDLLITLDAPVLSKMLKKLLRTYSPKEHWHFSCQKTLVDTYGCLTRQIEGDAFDILSRAMHPMDCKGDGFLKLWQNLVMQTAKIHDQYVKQLPWCDLKVFDSIASTLPVNQEVHLSNSTPVRYAQLFSWNVAPAFYGNRGTSGIDGCVSTAAGAAYAGLRPVTLITGDLAFFYDSNGLWHSHLPASFRVIVINNGGGGIFRFIPGPSQTPELESFFETQNSCDCSGIAQTFGLSYQRADDETTLTEQLSRFWNKSSKPGLLEVFTPNKVNGTVLKDYFKALSLPDSAFNPSIGNRESLQSEKK